MPGTGPRRGALPLPEPASQEPAIGDVLALPAGTSRKPQLTRTGPQTQAGKLLARKRPRLVPVTGEIIVAWVGPAGQTWRAPRHCLQDESLRRAIEALRSRQAGTASVLRLLDVALWMLHSESTAAGSARAAASVTPQR